jgi:hypothetical protein
LAGNIYMLWIAMTFQEIFFLDEYSVRYIQKYICGYKPKVVGSIPDVILFFSWPNTSSHTVASNRNEYQESSWD